jgi:hypothetical protein
VQERQFPVGRDDQQAVGLGDLAGHLRQELGAGHADRDGQADPPAYLLAQPPGDALGRAGDLASPPTSRNASSIEMPSTSGVVERKTSKTALLAAE